MYSRLLASHVLVVLAATATAGPGDRCEGSPLVQGSCFSIRGEMNVWNGWPPYLRIESAGRVYGVGPVENEIFPAAWSAFMPAAVRGDFRICPLGKESKAPYLEKPIALYCIESATNAERESVERRRWEPIK